MARLYKEFTDEGDWFFKPWNKDVVTDPQTGKERYDFADAPAKLLLPTRELLGHARPLGKLARL